MKLSDIRKATHEQAKREALAGDPELLICLLKAGSEISPDLYPVIAKYMEGKIKRKRGRPKNRRIGQHRYQDFEVKIAAQHALLLVEAWRERRGGRRTYVNRAGHTVAVREQAIAKAIGYVERWIGGKTLAKPNQVDEAMRHRRKWGI
ncbi:hypothetical protein [Aurantimonas sp. 22II-16-19i]|uniref:hypothetical protein n=1 Tax=Aurantimonas sp. 22II-16-19i TaxID=1317114 RepID=UPI00111C1E96|nr:hypothetical protein [Aurantimonas sp. 22II-16-19i]